MNLDDIIRMPHLEFQRRYSIDTDPGEFNEDRLYIGSNEMLESYYPSFKEVKGVSISVMGGFDQVASLITHAQTDLDILFDINPYAVEYGNIRMGLCLCEDAVEYLQRLTSRKLTGNILDRFRAAVEAKDYDTVQSILQGQEVDRNYMEETHGKLTQYMADSELAMSLLERVADAVNVPEDKSWTGQERELSIYSFFDFFRENPSNWLFDSDRYSKMSKKVRIGETKLIQGDIHGGTLAYFVSLLAEAKLTLGFFYDSNARSGELSNKKRNILHLMQLMPADDKSLWLSFTELCGLSFRSHVDYLKRNYGE